MTDTREAVARALCLAHCETENGAGCQYGDCDQKWALLLPDARAAIAAIVAHHQAGLDVEAIIRDVAELPDRTSPSDWPEAMLVTADELRTISTRGLRTPATGEGE